MTADATHELVLTRAIAAPRQRVYDAFLDPKLVAAWWAPRGYSVPQVEIDPRLGGGFRVTMRTRTGETFSVAGSYRELSPHQRLVFSWKWQEGPMAALGETLVTVTLRELGERTEVQLKHGGFPSPDARERHTDGWNQCLNKLVDLTDREGSAASLTLYGNARSTYVRTVVMALAEKGLAYRHEELKPHSEQLLPLQPFGRVPALRDGDYTLFETSAILHYLEESFDGPSLLPMNARLRAKMQQWLSAVACYAYDPCVRNYVLQYMFPRGEGGVPERATIERALPEIKRVLSVFDAAYGDASFLVGGVLSLADLMLGPIVSSVRAFPEGKQIVEALPRLQRGHQALRDRPSFQRAHAVFG